MMTRCDRCQQPANHTKMSWFNQDILCPVCQEEEKKHPLFEQAKEADAKEVFKGNYNYQGLFGHLSWKEIQQKTIKPNDKKVGERMEERINVYFGCSYTDPNFTHVMPQGEVTEYLEDENGEKTVPFYSSEVESWLGRIDMAFRLYSVRPEKMEHLTILWKQVVKDAFDKRFDDEEFRQKMNAFTFEALS